MELNTNSLELSILSLVRVRTRGLDKLYKETNEVFPCTRTEFDLTVNLLYKEELIKAIASNNGGVVRIIDITADGLRLLRNSVK